MDLLKALSGVKISGGSTSLPYYDEGEVTMTELEKNIAKHGQYKQGDFLLGSKAVNERNIPSSDVSNVIRQEYKNGNRKKNGKITPSLTLDYKAKY